MRQLLLMAPPLLPVPRPVCPAVRAAVTEVNELASCVPGAVTAAALVVMPARPSASTEISRENSLML